MSAVVAVNAVNTVNTVAVSTKSAVSDVNHVNDVNNTLTPAAGGPRFENLRRRLAASGFWTPEGDGPPSNRMVNHQQYKFWHTDARTH